ncbi:redox-sensitive transcriptional activator SoxR [Arthrobacter sp. HY1533]|uniref:redox-sensitive transcriptional activator SoxR n=1 Tax=Arthrobacter sp. HY1533 TaxID=2970919 RepID=UPI0022B9F857|nr:redox-sensitive transcriptional activator SoxR [Arthrobacter sp. HY1533]
MARIAPNELLPIGDLARRAGISVPTVRYYEERGLIHSERTPGNKRLFPRHTLRRLAVVAAGQRVGLTLAEITAALAELPADRAPTQREWTHLSSGWQDMVARRIRQLEILQTSLDSCIGCGCLSLGKCTLFNDGDAAAAEGAGSRWMRRADAAGGRTIQAEGPTGERQ